MPTSPVTLEVEFANRAFEAIIASDPNLYNGESGDPNFDALAEGLNFAVGATSEPGQVTNGLTSPGPHPHNP